MKQKHLWRCTWNVSSLSDNRVAADCRHAWPFKSLGWEFSLVFPALKDGFDQTHACYRVGLNGINISPDSTRLWVNDLWMGRLWVFDRRPDGRCVTLVASTVTRNLKNSDKIRLPNTINV